MKNFLFGLGLFMVFGLSSCFDGSDDNLYDVNYQLGKDVQTIVKYISDNNLEMTQHYSGVYYNTTGQGEKYFPSQFATVKYDYSAYLLDGTKVLEDSEEIVRHKLDNEEYGQEIITGLLKQGQSGSFLVPSVYLYRNIGTSGIPANSVLRFELNLNEISDVKLGTDTTAIKNKLEADKVLNEYTKHESGIYYKLIKEGNGKTPDFSHRFEANYKLYDLEESLIQKGYAIFDLRQVIDAWRIILPFIKSGSEFSMYVPSSYAYGDVGSGDVPKDAILKFDITLISVEQ